MKRVELYGRVRHAVMIEGLSQREAARCFGIDPRTVRKMLSYSVPPGYVRTRPPVRPKLDPFIGIIDRILEEDNVDQQPVAVGDEGLHEVAPCLCAGHKASSTIKPRCHS